MTRLWLFVFFIFPCTLYAQSVEPYLSSLPKGSDLSVLVQSVGTNPQTLAHYKSDQFKQPASTQKVITALAAMLELGQDFRFSTQIQTNGKIINKHLIGDLIIQLSGDPTLSRDQLKSLISTVKSKGIDRIMGNVVLNTAIFTSHDKASGWSWNNLTACYNAPPSAAIIDGNCFNATLTPAATIGQKATVAVSASIPVIITSDVKTISASSKDLSDRYCELDIEHKGNNRYHLSGCIPYNKEKTFLRFSVLDGISYFSSLVKSELQQQKIALDGKIIESNQPSAQAFTVLATNQSAPLSELLTVMLKKSNNLYADTLFRTLGAHYYGISGTWRNSGDAVKQILRKKANLDLENVVIVDGSGLSRLNLMSADKMMEILQYIAANDSKLNLISKLPVAGVDGTLQYRKSFSKPPFKDIIHAKTGYIQGSYNLAGFIQTKKGNTIAFVQLLSGYQRDNEGEPKNAAIMRFETEFYQNFIQN